MLKNNRLIQSVLKIINNAPSIALPIQFDIHVGIKKFVMIRSAAEHTVMYYTHSINVLRTSSLTFTLNYALTIAVKYSISIR